MDYTNRRVTVMGLGHFGGGAAAARWLAARGAVVTVTDLADEHALADSLATLAGARIATFHLGGHREKDFRQADMVVVNPAVRPGDPFLEIARQSGAELTTEIELFIRLCPVPIVGVTGSNGKSTTAAMTAAILRAAGKPTWLGGNIGRSLLEQVAGTMAAGCVVLELSSFQLWHAAADAPMPHVAVVTSCTPNHLDWHATFQDYAAAKQRILAGQLPDDLAVLNTLDPEVASWAPLVRGRQAPLYPLDRLPELKTPGLHNRINAACAAAAAQAAACDEEAIRHGLANFQGLPQRLEQFTVVDGRRFYNDSTSTTPESTIAALRSLDEPVWLLAGGHDKGFDYSEMAAAIARGARGAAFFGSIGDSLRRLTTACAAAMPCTTVDTMDQALDWCWQRSKPGEAIVLSPGASSHDQFQNFRQRGRHFADLVAALAGSR